MKKQALLAVAASALFSVGAQAQFVIDEFAVNQATVADGTGPNMGAGGVATEIAAAGVIGGFRDLYVARMTNNDPSGCMANPCADPGEIVTARVNSVTGRYSMSSGDGLSARSIVRWNGGGGAGLNGLDYATAVNDIFTSTSFTTAQNSSPPRISLV